MSTNQVNTIAKQAAAAFEACNAPVTTIFFSPRGRIAYFQGNPCGMKWTDKKA